MSNIRKLFEKLCPVPEGLEWLEHMGEYVADNDTPLSVADAYNGKWRHFLYPQ